MNNLTVDVLHALLAQEKELLLQGDISAVSALTARKQKLVKAVWVAGSPSEVKTVETLLRRNAVLVGAALEGVRLAAQQFRFRREAEAQTRIYSRSGGTSEISENFQRKVDKTY